MGASYAQAVLPLAARPTVAPNVHPQCRNTPRINDDGFEELCHLVTEQDPDTALCGKDVSGYPWDPALAALRGVPGGGAGGDELTLGGRPR